MPITLDFSGVKIAYRKEGAAIWDPVRKKEVKADPEEEVRQYLIGYITQKLDYPQSLISVEKALTVGELSKRYDLVIHDREAQPQMLVECKSPRVKLSQNAFDQIGRYNLALQVPWLVVTNGADTFCAKVNFQEKSFAFQHQLPDFHQLCTF
jgi:hypothetical protein